MAQQGPRTEFSQALKAIATERGLDADVILETIRQAYVAAYKRDAKEEGVDVDANDYDAEIDPVTGEAKIMGWPLEKPEEKKDVTPPGFGRIAAQTAKQVIHQKIREAEKGAIMIEFSDRVGSLISGIVLRFDGPNVRVDLGRTEAVMLAEDRIPSERLNPGQRLTFLLKSIEEGPRGKQIFLSRSDPEFVKKVFMREVPEIASSSVEIKGIAREPGVRTKIAVFSSQSGVDPVGSCVGQKGVRVQAVTNELGGERVDIIPWVEGENEFIKATLAPVEVNNIQLEEIEGEHGKVKTAFVTVPEDQLSLAIGKEGQNVRLASQLTGWRIEIQGSQEGVKEKPSEITEQQEGEEPTTEGDKGASEDRSASEVETSDETPNESEIQETDQHEETEAEAESKT